VICGGSRRIGDIRCPECFPESILYFVEAIDYRSNVEMTYQSQSAAAVAAWLASRGFRWRHGSFVLDNFHRKWLIARIRFGGDELSAHEQFTQILPWLPAQRAA
jgi:hypothetical protein